MDGDGVDYEVEARRLAELLAVTLAPGDLTLLVDLLTDDETDRIFFAELARVLPDGDTPEPAVADSPEV